MAVDIKPKAAVSPPTERPTTTTTLMERLMTTVVAPVESTTEAPFTCYGCIDCHLKSDRTVDVCPAEIRSCYVSAFFDRFAFSHRFSSTRVQRNASKTKIKSFVVVVQHQRIDALFQMMERFRVRVSHAVIVLNVIDRFICNRPWSSCSPCYFQSFGFDKSELQPRTLVDQ